MPLGVDQKFADYVVVRRLGAGGMGEVYLVQHPRLPRRDALKLLVRDVQMTRRSGSGSFVKPTSRRRCGIPISSGCTTAANTTVNCGSRWTSSTATTPPPDHSAISRRHAAELVTTIVTAVAVALDYAHKKGLLAPRRQARKHHAHPLGRRRERRILLTDFGIARTGDDISGLTATNMTVGTVAYTAPEQLMGEQIDGRADQYSLAATTYHLLTGSRLFHTLEPRCRHQPSPQYRAADSRR